MVSSTDAFDKFWMWKNSRTWLKVTLWTKGEPEPDSFIAAVAGADEEELTVSFAGEDKSLCVIDFRECDFRLDEKILLALRGGGNFCECEDTGTSWTPIGGK
jgi:hypothetical protein